MSGPGWRGKGEVPDKIEPPTARAPRPPPGESGVMLPLRVCPGCQVPFGLKERHACPGYSWEPAPAGACPPRPDPAPDRPPLPPPRAVREGEVPPRFPLPPPDPRYDSVIGKPWRCTFGFHDWRARGGEYVSAEEMTRRLGRRPDRPDPTGMTTERFEQCRRCNATRRGWSRDSEPARADPDPLPWPTTIEPSSPWPRPPR